MIAMLLLAAETQTVKCTTGSLIKQAGSEYCVTGGKPPGVLSLAECSDPHNIPHDYFCFETDMDEATRTRIEALEDEVATLKATVAGFRRQLDGVMAAMRPTAEAV